MPLLLLNANCFLNLKKKRKVTLIRITDFPVSNYSTYFDGNTVSKSKVPQCTFNNLSVCKSNQVFTFSNSLKLIECRTDSLNTSGSKACPLLPSSTHTVCLVARAVIKDSIQELVSCSNGPPPKPPHRSTPSEDLM